MLKIGHGPAGVVIVEGRLDATQAGTAQTFLDTVSGTTTLDCSALQYISSAGLGVLLKTQKRLKASAGELKLTGVSRPVHDILSYGGFDQIFQISVAG